VCRRARGGEEEEKECAGTVLSRVVWDSFVPVAPVEVFELEYACWAVSAGAWLFCFFFCRIGSLVDLI
jgi:hypothetical protein